MNGPEYSIPFDFFENYVSAIEYFEDCQAAFMDARQEATAFLQSVKKRQERDAAKVATMIAELDAEERELREAVREQAKTRGSLLLNGETPPAMDMAAGARLAVIPEERAALQDLMNRRRMTPKEKKNGRTIYTTLTP